MLSQGITVVFKDSAFYADIISLTLEQTRGDFEISSFDDMYRAMQHSDLIEGSLSMGVGFDPDTSPPIDGDIERVYITWPKSGNQTRGPLWYFDGYFVEYAPGAEVDGYMSARFDIKITGTITYRAGIRGCRVAPRGQSDYLNSSAAAKIRYGWVADNADQLMSDDTSSYLIMPRGYS